MARPLRLQIGNGVYHVTNRGVERRNIVRDDEDRQNWLRLLGRVAQRCRWRVFAYTRGANCDRPFLIQGGLDRIRT